MAKAQQQSLERAIAEERVLVKLLRLSHALIPLEDLLQQFLSSLLNSVPWLRLLPRAGIFISTQGEKEEILKLVASENFSLAHRSSCARVPYGKCLCGVTAQSRKIQFVDCVDNRHEIRYSGMVDHGHYIVPIISDQKLLGVMVLYLPKGHVRASHEEAFLCRVAEVLAVIITRKQAEAEIELLAYYDPLTHLPNRRVLLDRLQLGLAVTARRHRYGAVLYLDLDKFKYINDTLGHSMGDTLLREVGKRLSRQMRSEDTVARLGGDEFVILLPDLGNNAKKAAKQAAVVAKKIQVVLCCPVILRGDEYRISTSIGITLFPGRDGDINEILQQADTAMYMAKVDGRNIIRFFKQKMQSHVNTCE